MTFTPFIIAVGELEVKHAIVLALGRLEGYGASRFSWILAPFTHLSDPAGCSSFIADPSTKQARGKGLPHPPQVSRRASFGRAQSLAASPLHLAPRRPPKVGASASRAIQETCVVRTTGSPPLLHSGGSSTLAARLPAV